MKPNIKIFRSVWTFWFVKIRIDKDYITPTHGKSKSEAIRNAKQELIRIIDELDAETQTNRGD